MVRQATSAKARVTSLPAWSTEFQTSPGYTVRSSLTPLSLSLTPTEELELPLNSAPVLQHLPLKDFGGPFSPWSFPMVNFCFCFCFETVSSYMAQTD